MIFHFQLPLIAWVPAILIIVRSTANVMISTDNAPTKRPVVTTLRLVFHRSLHYYIILFLPWNKYQVSMKCIKNFGNSCEWTSSRYIIVLCHIAVFLQVYFKNIDFYNRAPTYTRRIELVFKSTRYSIEAGNNAAVDGVLVSRTLKANIISQLHLNINHIMWRSIIVFINISVIT